MDCARFSTACLIALLFVVPVLSGCQEPSADPAAVDIPSLRGRLLLAEEPDDVLGVIEAREALEISPQATGRTITLVGRIGGPPQPWVKDKASFVIADPSVDLPDHQHEDGEACQFCAKMRAGKETLAVIEFQDDAGKVLGVDAKELFDLQQRQMVVVRGRPKLDKSGYLVLAADGIYVRR